MFENLALWCHRRRWTVLFVWVVAAVALTALAGAIGGAKPATEGLPGTDSDRGYHLFVDHFPKGSDETSAIVFHRAGGLAGQRDEIERYLADAQSVGHTSSLTSPFSHPDQLSTDGSTAYAGFGFVGRPDDAALTRRAAALDHRAQALRADGVRVEFLGDAFTTGGVPSSELYGLLAAVVILLIAFGSLVAMGLPIVTAVIGIVIGLAGVSLWSHALQTPGFTVQVASMVGIGVGIDYALFIVTRYRDATRWGSSSSEAVAEAIGTAGRAVAFAGCTVMVSLLGMFLMGQPFLYGLAVGTSTAVLVAVLAALTLIPALLGLLGRHLDRFSVHRRSPRSDRETGWHRWGRFVQRHPAAFAMGSLALLVVAALPVTVLRLGAADPGNDPVGSTTRGAYDLLAQNFGPGVNGPLIVVARTPDAASRQAVRGLPALLARTPGVSSVGPVIPAPDGAAALVSVIPSTAPQDPRTAKLVGVLRRDVIPEAHIQAYVGGETAMNIDFSRVMGDRLPVFIGAVLALSFVLLALVFRSLLVPLKAVVMNLLSIGAAYGLMVAVFQWGWFGLESRAPIEPWAPMMLFAIVFGLSMDYEVFLLSSMKEHYDRFGDNSGAVVEGLAGTARVITAAAAIMVCVFGSFLVGDLRAIRLIGLGLAAAVLIDATVVRMVLVPATMELLGRRNWWMPAWLDQRLPHLSIERQSGAAATPLDSAPGPGVRAPGDGGTVVLPDTRSADEQSLTTSGAAR